MVDDERDRSARDGVGGELVAVAREAADAEEGGAGLHPAVAKRQRDDLDVRGVGGGVAEELAQRHPGRSLDGHGDVSRARRRQEPGAIRRYGSAKRMISANAGAATSAP